MQQASRLRMGKARPVTDLNANKTNRVRGKCWASGGTYEPVYRMRGFQPKEIRRLNVFSSEIRGPLLMGGPPVVL